RPESGVVRFHSFREPLRDSIIGWALDPDQPIKLRLQAGEGGAGKTRLLNVNGLKALMAGAPGSPGSPNFIPPRFRRLWKKASRASSCLTTRKRDRVRSSNSSEPLSTRQIGRTFVSCFWPARAAIGGTGSPMLLVKISQ